MYSSHPAQQHSGNRQVLAFGNHPEWYRLRDEYFMYMNLRNYDEYLLMASIDFIDSGPTERRVLVGMKLTAK